MHCCWIYALAPINPYRVPSTAAHNLRTDRQTDKDFLLTCCAFIISPSLHHPSCHPSILFLYSNSSLHLSLIPLPDFPVSSLHNHLFILHISFILSPPYIHPSLSTSVIISLQSSLFHHSPSSLSFSENLPESLPPSFVPHPR